MRKVIVAGGGNLDTVLYENQEPCCFPGGKGANQAVAAARQGANTIFIGKIGYDGAMLKEFLIQNNLDVSYLTTDESVQTGAALITVSSTGENNITCNAGANKLVSADDITIALHNIALNNNDILVSQYEIPATSIKKLYRLGKEKGTTTILNPAPPRKYQGIFDLSDIIIVNEDELAFFGGTGDVVETVKRLQKRKNQTIIATLGSKGIYALTQDKTMIVPAYNVTAVDTSGAGDCFVGSLAANLAKENTIENAILRANAAAAVSVQRKGAGTSMPTKEEVDAFLSTIRQRS